MAAKRLEMSLAGAKSGGPSHRRGPPWVDWMVLPTVAVLAFVIAYPSIRTLILSGYHENLLNPAGTHPIGFSNYGQLAHDSVFWTAARNTLVFTAVSVAIGMVLGLGIALLLAGLPVRPRFLQGALLTPWAVPVIVVAFLFRYMFDQQVGVINFLLGSLHLIGSYIPWLASTRWSMPAVIVANVWSQTPFYVLMFVAGLKSIPDDVREAARMDGATGWREFWSVTVPFLQNTLVIASIIMVIGNFNNFPLVWAMTGGGPVYATTTLVVYIYQLAFSQFSIGYASAVGTIWLIVLLALAVTYIRVLQRESLQAVAEA
ncbi:MAG: carbohydrate ABC transporter permease [Chloroflexota bacterium]